MSEIDETTNGRNESGLYEIRLKGHLDARWTSWFEGARITHDSDGTTLLTVRAADQPALHGLLRKVRDLGLPLVSVNPADSEPANRQDVNASTDQNHSSTKETNT